MNLSELEYTYPPERVALFPPEHRSSARMMAVGRRDHSIRHDHFRNLPDYFAPGEVLVLNNTRVLPYRLVTKRKTGGRLEVLLLREMGPGLWRCLISPHKRGLDEEELSFGDQLRGRIVSNGGGPKMIRLSYTGSLNEILDQVGHTPLPPYIKRDEIPPLDRMRYQTVYAQEAGSAAAPTAGLHFTHETLSALKKKGVLIRYLTLHVGEGTFLPIRSSRIEDHEMHSEFFEIPEETAQTIKEAKREGRLVSAVGTTTVRALESATDESGFLLPGRRSTKKFIYPPYPFRMVDRLLTNFHRPQSTLLALVFAYAGGDLITKAYREAIATGYRLFSYGDCMWIM